MTTIRRRVTGLEGCTPGKNRKISRRPLVQTGCSRTLEVELQLSSSLVRSRFSFCGRCWVRTNVGDADGFTDRSLWPLGQPAKPADLRPLAGETIATVPTCTNRSQQRPPLSTGVASAE